MAKSNKVVLEEANAEISKGNFEGFLSSCSDDIIWTMIGDETLRGKQAVRSWMKSTYAKPPVFAAENFISENDYVTVYGDIAIESKDGQVTRSLYCDVWRFRDGKMIELSAYAIVTGEK